MTLGMRILPGQLDVLEDVYSCRGAGWRFERIRADIDLQDDVDDVLQLHLVNARADVDAVARMKTDLSDGMSRIE
jgi:hypothetical protein